MIKIDSKNIETKNQFVNKDGILIREYECCTHSCLGHLFPLIKKLGFSMIGSHGLQDNYNMTNRIVIHGSKNMEGLIADAPSRNYTKLSLGLCSPQSDGRGPIRDYISSVSNSKFDTLVKDFSDKNGFSIFDSASDRVIGYYNTNSNTLFICDVTHEYSGATYLEKILNEVAEFQTFHKIKITTPEPAAVTYLPSISKDIIMGMDPEVVLRKTGANVSVPKKFQSPTAEVGSDGNYIELRPKPGGVKELKATVEKLYKKLHKGIDKDTTVFSGGGIGAGAAIGGHIHFNIPSSKQFTTMLDDFIGKPFKQMNGSMRCGNNYGKLGSIENKSYGFEYRTPPSFVGNPVLFEAVMAVAYCVAQTWKKICNEKGEFEYAAGDVTGAGKTEYAKLEEYAAYAEHIDTFIEYIGNPDKTIEEPDVLAAWKIRKPIKDIVV